MRFTDDEWMLMMLYSPGTRTGLIEELQKMQAEESEKKHIRKERKELEKLLEQEKGSKLHAFCGYDQPCDMILTTDRGFAQMTAEQIHKGRKAVAASGVRLHTEDLNPSDISYCRHCSPGYIPPYFWNKKKWVEPATGKILLPWGRRTGKRIFPVHTCQPSEGAGSQDRSHILPDGSSLRGSWKIHPTGWFPVLFHILQNNTEGQSATVPKAVSQKNGLSLILLFLS